MITYKTNGASTSKSMTEWYFGKAFVKNLTDASIRINQRTKRSVFKYWQSGTGFLTITVSK